MRRDEHARPPVVVGGLMLGSVSQASTTLVAR